MAEDVVRIELKDMPGFQRRLQEFSDGTEQGLANALYQIATEIFAESQRLVPVQYGTLRSSGGVEGPYQNSSGNAEVLIYYGGAAAGYAIHVHENLEAYHEPPTQAKFLEQSFIMVTQDISAEAAMEIAKEHKRRGLDS